MLVIAVAIAIRQKAEPGGSTDFDQPAAINHGPFTAPAAGRDDRTFAAGRRGARVRAGAWGSARRAASGGRKRGASRRSGSGLKPWQDAQERGDALDDPRGGWGRIDAGGDML